MKKTILFIAVALVLMGANSVCAFNYTLALETGGTEDINVNAGDIVNLAFDSTDQGIWVDGNIQIEFDPTVLEAVYVDESFDYEGFWTGWSFSPGDPTLCGGGEPYMYALGLGSDRGDLYAQAHGDNNAGPAAFIDNINGFIRFYHQNYLSPGNYEPLRIGFRVLQTGPVDIAIKSQAEYLFDWCDFDTEVVTSFVFGAPPTAEEILDDMVWLVTRELELPGKVEKTYVHELKKIRFALHKGRTWKTIAGIKRLIRKIQKDVRHGRIVESEGQYLIDMANALLDAMPERSNRHHHHHH